MDATTFPWLILKNLIEGLGFLWLQCLPLMRQEQQNTLLLQHVSATDGRLSEVCM